MFLMRSPIDRGGRRRRGFGVDDELGRLFSAGTGRYAFHWDSSNSLCAVAADTEPASDRE